MEINDQIINADPAKLTSEQRELLLVNDSFNAKIANFTQEEKDHFVQKGWRKFREGELPLTTLVVRATDYSNDLDRGTIPFDERLPNYSYSKAIIPDGTLIIQKNFIQNEPNTNAITGQNLKFVECNLTNVAIDPSWELTNCNTAQAWLIFDEEKGRERRLFVASHPNDLKGDEVEPQGVIKSRNF